MTDPSITSMEQWLINCPFEEVFESDLEKGVDLFLLLIQDPKLCQARIQKLQMSRMKVRTSFTEIPSLQTALQAIRKAVLRDEIRDENINYREIIRIAQDPQALWTVYLTMQELLREDLTSVDDQPLVETLPPSGEVINHKAKDRNDVERVHQKLQFILQLVTRELQSEETQLVASDETRISGSRTDGRQDDLTPSVNPLPWLLLWQQNVPYSDEKHSIWFEAYQNALRLYSSAMTDQEQSHAEVLRQSVQQALTKSGLSIPSLDQLQFDWNNFSIQSSCEYVFGIKKDDEPGWQTQIRHWLLQQHWRTPEDLWTMQLPNTGATGRDVNRYLRRLFEELSGIMRSLNKFNESTTARSN